MWRQVKSILNEPFSSQYSTAEKFKAAWVTGLFISLFLLIFQPFDLNEAGSAIYKYVILYGLITFVVSFIFSMVYGKLVDQESPSFTFGKWIVSALLLILCIAIGNYLLWLFMSGASAYQFIHWKGLLWAIYVTLLVGIFPTVAFGAYRLLRNKSFNSKIAASIEHSSKSDLAETNEIIELGELKFHKNDFHYAEAMENYVKIKLDKLETIRITMRDLEKGLEDFGLIRCHRSYIVNPSKVASVSGNAQGLKLKISDSEFEVPVSRKYIAKIKEVLS